MAAALDIADMRASGFVALTIALMAATVAGLTEIAVRVLVDDGMQYDIEMWRYARLGKQIASVPEVGHEHRPGASFRAMGVDVRINSLGLRGGEVAATRVPGRQRILMLGDSLTFGWGVREEDTVAHRLEVSLRAAGRDVEVLNAGVGNTNTAMQLAAYERSGRTLGADLVVLNYFINDAEMTPRYGPTSWLEEHSVAWIYLGARLDVLLRMLDSRADWRDYYRGLYAADSAGWQRAHAAIGRLAAVCREQGIPLLIVNYPELRELAPYPFPEVNLLLAGAVEANGIPFLDLLPTVAGKDERELWVTVPDPHPNGVADALFAAAIQPEVEKLLDAREAPPVSGG